MTSCYLCPGQIITENGHSACEGCGTSYPPVEPFCSAPGNSQRAGAFFSSRRIPSAGLSTPLPRRHPGADASPEGWFTPTDPGAGDITTKVVRDLAACSLLIGLLWHAPAIIVILSDLIGG